MPELARLKPDPIPPVHPVPEYLAEGELRARYEDMKAVLEVPWVGAVCMALAHYQRFYDTLWQGLRPLCLSRPFADACRDLRAWTEGEVMRLDPPPITARLVEAWYAPREIEAIQTVVEVFSHGNYSYLLLATIARLLLEGGSLAEGEAPPRAESPAPANPPFALMEPHHSDAPTRALYEDLKTSLGLPFVDTDYRALARWPSYFALAWMDLKPRLGAPAYDELVGEVHRRAAASAAGLPNPGRLSGEALRRAAEDGESPAVVRLFQWLLPGLVTNIAFFRAQLI